MKILFFSPHSAVWVHAFPEALVAEAAAQHGNEIVYIGCGGQLESYCVAMSANGVPYEATRSEKSKVCRLCKKNKEIIRGNFGFSGKDLADVVEPADLLYADELLASVTPSNYLEFSIDGVDLGKIALYELLISAKKSSLSFTAKEWERYRDSLRNAIIVLRTMKKVLDETQPDRVVVYNALYSVNRVVCRLAELRGIPQYFLHAGENLSNQLQTLMLDRGHNFLHYHYLRSKWAEVSETQCPVDAMKAVTDHFLEVINGKSPWAYSSASGSDADLRKYFRVEDNQKVICATMSSYDEMFAAETIGTLPSDLKLLFPMQLAWIQALVKFVVDRKDLKLIVRVHPREFPNKREGVLSEHAEMLKLALSVVPDNVIVNWPEDAVSIYDLADIVDVFANAWSTAGEEMVLLGIPVVLYSHDLTMYSSDINYVGTTEKEYFKQIELALTDGWSAERIRKAYRWAGMKLGYASLDISGSFQVKTYQKKSLMLRGVNKFVKIISPYGEQNSDCRNRVEKLPASAKINKILNEKLNSVLDIDEKIPNITLQEETINLKKEIKRLIKGLYGSTIETKKNSLANNLLNFTDS